MKAWWILVVSYFISLQPLMAKVEKGYYPNGQMHYNFTMKNSGLDGTYTYWFQNGKKAVEGKFNNGKRVGLWQAWYENGNLCYDRNFVDGNENGITTYYYENGQKQASGSYQNNLRQGHWQIWNDDGKLRCEGECERDLFNGKWMFYENNDTVYKLFDLGIEYFESRIKHYTNSDYLQTSVKSLILINQFIGKNSRFILRMNFCKVYLLERDFDSSQYLNGFLEYKKQYTTTPPRPVNRDCLKERTYYAYQYGGFVNNLKNGKFRRMTKYIENYSQTTRSEDQITNYNNDTICGTYLWKRIDNDKLNSYCDVDLKLGEIIQLKKNKYKIVENYYSYNLPDSAKSFQLNHFVSRFKYIIKADSTIFVRNSNNLKRYKGRIFEFVKIDNSFDIEKFISYLSHGEFIKYPIFECLEHSKVSKIPGLLLSSDTIRFFNCDTVSSELNFTLFHHSHNLDYFFPKSNDGFIYRLDSNNFVVDFLGENSKVLGSYSFTKDPLYKEFSYSMKEEFASSCELYLYSLFQGNTTNYYPTYNYYIPSNHVMNGESIIYNEKHEIIGSYIFDYGFLKEYKNYQIQNP